MKMIFILLFWVLFSAQGAEARMTSGTFNAGEKVTAGKLFLNQVDAVSLYLTTERVVYVPKLTSDLRLHVELTLLGMSADNQEALRSFVMRHVSTFNKTLRERLEYQTPALAKEFDPEKDVQFSIHVGTNKKKVATWAEGQWMWVARVKEAQAPRAEQAVPAKIVSAQPVEEELVRGEKKNYAKKCPALME